MINSFLIKAIPDSNILKIVLDGLFMKSEVELALLLIKTEKLKLREGFKLIIDIKNFKTKGTEDKTVHFKIHNLVRDNNNLVNNGVNEKSSEYYYQNVG